MPTQRHGTWGHTSPCTPTALPSPKHASWRFFTSFQAGSSFFQSLFITPSYCLIQLMVIFLSCSTSFGKTPSQAAFGCLSEWAYAHFSSFAAVVTQAIRPKGGILRVPDIHSLGPLSLRSHPTSCHYSGHLSKRRTVRHSYINGLVCINDGMMGFLPWNRLHFWKASCFHMKYFQMPAKLLHCWREYCEEVSLC